MARRNAKTIVAFTTAYPFRLPTESLLMCVYCTESYAEPPQFRKHMVEEHSKFRLKTAFAHAMAFYLKVDLTDFRCRICDKGLDDLTDAANHLNDAHKATLKQKIDFDHPIGLQPYKFSDNRISCVLCEKNFPSIRLLSRHMATHYLNYTCEACGKSFSSKDSLSHHVRFTHVPGQHICRRCRKGFPTLEERRLHIESTENCWQYTCYECNRRFFRYTEKERHLIEVHGQQKKVHQCPECGQSFGSRKTYGVHFSREHAGKKFFCSECGREYASRAHLERHNATAHNKRNVLECTICFNTFDNRVNYYAHMKTTHGVVM